MRPLVSVVIPSYNHARYLGQAISSVLQQTHRALELIVIDDGSTDQSPQILQGVRDPRFRFELQANGGAHQAINRGLGMARGELLAVLNSDDRFHPRRLERAVAAFQRAPDLQLWGSWIEIIGAEGEVLGQKRGYEDALPFVPEVPERTFMVEEDLKLNLLQSNYWATTSNFVFPRRVLERVGGMARLRYAHDWDFALRVQREGQAHLEREALMQYRLHGANTIAGDRVGMVFEVLWILAVHLRGYLRAPSLDVSGGPESLRRLSQLRYSLHVHGCWRTFALLSAFLEVAEARAEPAAEALLDDLNPVRAWLMGEIAAELDAQLSPSTGALPVPQNLWSGLRRFLWRAQPSRS